METLQGKESLPIGRPELARRTAGYATIAVDIGTGDGKFVYRLAQRHPDWFCIGIDPARENLAGCAARAHRKPARGGLGNVLYVIAGAEDLPPELDGLAHHLYINFPWGSLLAGLVCGSPILLANLARIAAPGATLELRINYSLFTEPASLEVRDLPTLTPAYVDQQLVPAYAAAGLVVVKRGLAGPEHMPEVATTWAKRLAHGKELETMYLRAQVRK